MISPAVDLTPGEIAAENLGAFRRVVRGDTERPQAADHGVDTVRFLNPELFEPGKPADAVCGSGSNEQYRKLVDRQRYAFSRNVDGLEPRGPDDEVGYRLLATHAGVLHLDVAAHLTKNLDDARPRRVNTNVPDDQLATGTYETCDQEECGR